MPLPRREELLSVGEQLRVVGQPVTRIDVVDKLTGKARYAVDHSWAGTLHGVIVRSERAHANLLGVDVEEALTRPGIEAVVTGKDLEGISPYFGHHRADQPILAIDKVRYWGEPVAVVVADTRERAEDAVSCVRARYEDLRPLMNVHESMRPDAQLIHADQPATGSPFGPVEAGRQGTNEGFTSRLEWGDIDEAMARAHATVVTRNEIPMLYAFAMEPHNAQARFVDGILEVTASAQHPFQVQKELSRIFGLTTSQVRVSSPLLGGGYGSKAYTKLEPLAAACSRAVGGRAVKLVLDLEQSIYTARTDPALVEVSTGFAEDGRILGRDIRVVMDTGAYTENSPQVLLRAVTRGFGPYRVPALRVRASGIFTTTAPASSYRGFGAYHTNVASESNMDRAAAELGIDPVEIRLVNLIGRGEELIPGMRPMDADLAQNLRLVQDALKGEPKAGKLHGSGFSCAVSDAGANPTSMATVRLLADGTALLQTGSIEMGQGSRTVLAQIAAEELDLDLSRVVVAHADTQVSPFMWSTGASRTTTLVGLCVQRACADVRTQVLALAASMAGMDEKAFSWEDGQVVGPAGQLSPADVIGSWFGQGSGEVIGIGRVERRGEFAMHPAFWEVGMVGVAVNIDPDTGEIEIDQLVSVADVGRAVNRSAIEGQEYGASTQGLGAALFEELIYEGPQIVNANLVDYRVPRISDVPTRVHSEIVERGDGIGPYGIKGVGEGAMTATGGAVFAAVSRATGKWPTRGPLTPERVWRLIHAPENVEADGPSPRPFFPSEIFGDSGPASR